MLAGIVQDRALGEGNVCRDASDGYSATRNEKYAWHGAEGQTCFAACLIRERQGKQTVAESQRVRTGVGVRRVETGRECKHDKRDRSCSFSFWASINRPRESIGWLKARQRHVHTLICNKYFAKYIENLLQSPTSVQHQHRGCVNIWLSLQRLLAQLREGLQGLSGCSTTLV